MSIGLQGKVRIENGENVIEGSNSFVRNAAVMLLTPFMLEDCYNNRDLGRDFIDVKTGYDVETETSWNRVALVDGMGTPPNVLDSEPVEGDDEYRLKITATWNKGELSGTLGEIGFFLGVNVSEFEDANSPVTVRYWLDTGGESGLWSRMCVADGDFEAFEIDENSPLTIEWHLVFKFKGDES